jgi:hypothetical protein
MTTNVARHMKTRHVHSITHENNKTHDARFSTNYLPLRNQKVYCRIYKTLHLEFGLHLGRINGLFSSPKYPERLCSAPSVQFSGHQVYLKNHKQKDNRISK